jgi:hypothetical protein
MIAQADGIPAGLEAAQVADHLGDRDDDVSCARSSSVTTSSTFGLPLAIAVSPSPRYRNGMHYLCQILVGQDTSATHFYRAGFTWQRPS